MFLPSDYHTVGISLQVHYWLNSFPMVQPSHLVFLIKVKTIVSAHFILFLNG